jgi:hypothetical protein
MPGGSPRRCLFAAMILAVGLATAPAGAENVFLSVEHRVASLESAIAPELYGTTLLFSHRPQRATRYVALRLRDDATLYVYGRQVQRAGTPQAFTIFVLAFDLAHYRLPADGRLYYRLTVDGTWMTDPANPARERDAVTGLDWSVVTVDPEAVQPPRSPQWLDAGLVRFLYRGEPGQTIALLGDFNRWDPYMHVLSETAPGRYSIELKLPPGSHDYMFSVDGVWVEDPLNAERDVDREGRRVCVVSRDPPRPVDARAPAGPARTPAH